MITSRAVMLQIRHTISKVWTLKRSLLYENSMQIVRKTCPRKLIFVRCAHGSAVSKVTHKCYCCTLSSCLIDYNRCNVFADFDEQINDNLVHYQRQLVAGFDYNSSMFLGGYSFYFKHSSSVVYNIIANTLLQLAHPGASITVHNHPISVKSGVSKGAWASTAIAATIKAQQYVWSSRYPVKMILNWKNIRLNF